MTPNELSASTQLGTVPAATAAHRHRRALEFPTLLLLSATYAGWLAITPSYAHWPLLRSRRWRRFFITLHSSLQHEIVHGHPTRWRALNRLLAVRAAVAVAALRSLPHVASQASHRRAPHRPAR